MSRDTYHDTLRDLFCCYAVLGPAHDTPLRRWVHAVLAQFGARRCSLLYPGCVASVPGPDEIRRMHDSPPERDIPAYQRVYRTLARAEYTWRYLLTDEERRAFGELAKNDPATGLHTSIHNNNDEL